MTPTHEREIGLLEALFVRGEGKSIDGDGALPCYRKPGSEYLHK
jgi:hypothetical protein